MKKFLFFAFILAGLASKAQLSVTIRPENSIICSGITATLEANVTGQTGTPTYAWSNNAGTTQTIKVTPKSSTTYTVTVTAGGQTAISSYPIEVTPIPDARIITTSNVICLGDSIILNASGGHVDELYLWNNSLGTTSKITVRPTMKTEYTVRIVYHGCFKDTSIVIDVNNCHNLKDSVIVAKDTTGLNIVNRLLLSVFDSCFLNYSVPLDSFKIENFQLKSDSVVLHWAFFQSGKKYNVRISVLKKALIKGLNLATLQIKCTQARALHTNLFKASFDYTETGINSINKEKIRVYPNPAANTLTIELPTGMQTDCSIELYTIDSKKLIHQKATSSINTIDISPFPKGVYLLKVVSAEGTMIERVVKR